jgi:hypothetical protein
MAQAEVAVDPGPTGAPRPWTQQLIDSLGVSPAWVGGGLVVADMLSCIAFFALAGDPVLNLRHEIFWTRVFLPSSVIGVLMGYVVAGVAYSRRLQLRTLERLRPVLDCDAQGYRELVHEVQAFDTRRLRIIGLGFAVAVPPLVIANPDPFAWRLGDELLAMGHAVILWLVWHNAISMWFFSRGVALEQRAARLFSRIGRDLAVVDVLDLAPLAPFARRGLQAVLFYVIGLSIFSLLFVGGWATNLAPSAPVVVVPTALVALLLPLRGVHQRIHQAKRTRLDALQAEIRRDEAEVMDRDAPGCAAAAARLPALLALRARVESTREWPLDFANWVRFVLYLAIGLGSWLGGALVEHGVDVVLGWTSGG